MEHLVFDVMRPSTCARALLKSSVVVVCAFLVATVTWADTVPGDPDVAIDAGGDPFNLSTSINLVQPDGVTADRPFSFINDAGGIVTSLTFNTKINPGLMPTEVASFGCPAQGYFLTCMVNYTKSTGALQYQFFGVRPSDGDENFPIFHDPEFGEFEGIPIGGEFTIHLRGWLTGATATDGTLLYTNLPKFDNSFTVPEPSLVLLLAVQFLVLVSTAGVVRRRAKRKEQAAA